MRRRIAQERKAVEALETDADAWHRAERIRAYAIAVEYRNKEAGELNSGLDWLAWARAQADRLDPMIPSPSSILDTPEQDYRAFDIWQTRDDE